MTQRVDEGH